MTSWDDVDVDVAGDETINFGPRVERGSALYQVDTVATVSARGQVTGVPKIRCCISDESFALAAESDLTLFDNGCRRLIHTVPFDSTIDCLAHCADADFLVLGERNGNVHFVDPNVQEPLFSKKLAVASDADDGPTFLHMAAVLTEEGTCDVLILLSGGRLAYFTNLKLSALCKALEIKDLGRVKDIHSQVKMMMVDTSTAHDGGASFVAHLPTALGRSVVTAGGGTSVLSLWEQQHDTITLTDSAEPLLTTGACIVKCLPVQGAKYILCLDDQGQLSLWSISLLSVVRRWTDKAVTQFLLLETGDMNNNLCETQVVVLTKPESGVCSLQIHSLPLLETLYQLELSAATWLAHCPPHQESVFIIEGVNDEDRPGDQIVSTLRIRSLTEALPETRFNRLLHKNRFNEAEQFAKLFDLDVELVYKVKANDLIDQLSPWKVEGLSKQETADRLDELRACLKLIKDDGQIVDSCTRSSLPTFETTLELLTLARNRLNDSLATLSGGEKKTKKQGLLTRVMETMHRLGTFQVAFGSSDFSGSKWEHFRLANMLEEFLDYLSQGRLGEAFSIWNRHQSEFDEVFSCEVVEDVLLSVPQHIPADDLKHWLQKDFIPYVISVLPDGLSGWPRNALEFCELLQSTCVNMSQAASDRGFATADEFATQMCNLSVGYSQVEKSEQTNGEEGDTDAFVSLHLLILQLRDLVNLHSKYNCRLSLAEYGRETTESLTYCMLDRVVALELIPSTIQTVIRPYMKEHGLNEDKMLFQYIGDLTQRLGSTSTVIGEASWEAKAIVVIGCIKNTEYKCSAILDAMRTAYVPWSTDMQALVQGGLALDHPSVAKLRDQCKLMELQKLLASYNLRGYYMANSSTAETMVYHILTKDRPTALQDALEVIKAFNKLDPMMAYRFQLQYLIEQNRVGESVALLSSLPESQAVTCGHRLVINTLLRLDQEDIAGQQKQIVLQCQASCDILKYLLTLDIESSRREEFQRILQDLTHIHALQVEFGQFVSHKDYCREEYRKQFLVKQLKLFYLGQGNDLQCIQNEVYPDRKPNRKKTWSFTKIFRLAEVLQIPLDTLRGQTAITAAEQGEADIAVKKAKELYEHVPTPETGRVLYTVARTLCKQLAGKQAATPAPAAPENIHQLSADIHELACQALTICQPELLADCLSLCKSCSQAHAICSQCESGDYGIAVQRGPCSQQDLSSLDPYQTWTFDTFYQEDGLVMDSSVATPLAYQYVQATLPDTAPSREPYQQHRIQGQPSKVEKKSSGDVIEPLATSTQSLMQYLSDNRQTQLSLQLLVDSLGVTLQHWTLDSRGSHHTACDLARTASLTRGLSQLTDLTTCLLDKMLKQKRVDHSLALGYMCGLERNDVYNWLEETVEAAGHSYRKVQALSRLGKDYAELNEHTDKMKEFQSLETRAQWGHALAKFKISFRDGFQRVRHAERKVLCAMVANTSVSLSLITDFCSAFALSEDEALHGYLQQQLVPPCVSGGGDAPAHLNAALGRAKHCIASLSNDNNLHDKLDTVLQQLDLYDYERQVFVIKHMEEIQPNPSTNKKLELLDYLKSYQRVTPPSKYELEYKAVSLEDELMNDSRALSPLANTRLPYHPLTQGEPWKILTPELNVDTLPVLLGIADILQLSKDQVYLTTIQNIVTRHVETRAVTPSSGSGQPAGSRPGVRGQPGSGPGNGGVDKASCNWHDDGEQTDNFFKTVAHLLLKVSNCEMAVVCGNWIVKTLPMGSEKVLALKAVVALAHKWLEACSPGQSAEREKAQATLDKFSTICRRLSTEQVLFQHNLGQQNLLNLCNKPRKLLFGLYSHDSILKRVAGTSIVENLPDIHQVADRVAEINKISAEKIRLELVDKWLPSCHQNKQDDLDSTMTFNLNVNMLDMTLRTDDEISEDEVNLKRVTYILQHGQLDRNALFLLNFAFHKPSNKVTNVCRVRALRCLFALVDKPTIERLGNMTVEEIREHMKNWLYLVELERLHVPETSFGQCNKEGLVRGIWRNHSHERRAVRLVADLCLDYEIYDVQLWNSMLQQLLAFQMMEYLRHVLLCLSAVPTLWQVDCVQKMWKTVLEQPLLAAVPPVSGTQLEECLSSFALLHRCPMLLDLDLLGFSQLFLKLEMGAAALGCILLLPDSSSCQSQVDVILQPGVHPRILDQLTEWVQADRRLPMLDQMQQAVFQHIDLTGQFDTIGDHNLAELVSYLLRQDQIEGLLLHGLRNGRLAQAIHLTTLHREMHQDSMFAKAIHQMESPPSPTQQLLMFLDMTGLRDDVEEFLPPQPEDEVGEDEDQRDSLSSYHSVFSTQPVSP